MKNIALGRHRIGDFFWYTTFEDSNFFDFFEQGNLIKGKEFKTHEDVMGVITYIHESYHLIQDLMLGVAAWIQYNSDEVAINIHEITKKLPAGNNVWPLSTASILRNNPNLQRVTQLRQEAKFLHDCVYTSNMTDAVLDAEIKAHLDLADSLLKDAYGLSGQDLLECHAAILTERFMAQLVAKYPSAFDKDILHDLEPYFLVEKMESSRQVLSLFSEFVSFVKFDTANKQHPLYPECARAAEYGLLLFALDYALHIYPVDATDRYFPPDIQDVIPTARFLKILGSILPCIMELKDRSSFVLSEDYLYSDFMEHLVTFNNKMNKKARKAASFYVYGEITGKWQELYKAIATRVNIDGLISLFELFYGFRSKALNMVKQDPLQVYQSNIINVSTSLGLNPMVSTNTKVGLAIPYVAAVEGDRKDGYKILPSPIEMMDTFVAREIFKELSDMIFGGDAFKCPAGTRLLFYPCNQRSDGCKCISRPGGIPDCFARQVLKDYYPQYAGA